MFLSVDIGNSNIVLGLYAEGEWKHIFRYSSDLDKVEEFYINGFQDILLEWRVHPSEIKQIGFSSVVPHLTERVVKVLEDITLKQVFILDPPLFEHMDLEVPLPYEIGSDLVANSYAVHCKHNRNTIIIDFGTALTFTVFQKDKGIKGVTFVPGIRTAFKALSGNTAQLPEVDLELPEQVIGRDTMHAIQSGILYGYLGLVKEILTRMETELGARYYIIATGGMSSQLPLENEIDLIDKRLTLDGIRLLYQDYASPS